MNEERKVKAALVGNGNRGRGLLSMLFNMEDVEIVAVCDTRDDKLEDARQIAGKKGKDLSKILFTKDYKEVLAMEEVEAVFNTTSWASHINVAVDAMEAGKDVSIEVGGTNSIEDIWRLVRTQEKTGKRCMMLENCCYGRIELAMLNMVRQGVFGQIVHCTGGYGHDLRWLFYDMATTGRERVIDYLHRNCDTYPTHALGPIAKILNINRGNRMVSLTSTASCAAGMEEYVNSKDDKSHPLYGKRYTQGDIVTTTIKCAHGETIVLTLDTTLPRPYSRFFTVRGTKGMFSEDGRYVYTQAQHEHRDGDGFKTTDIYRNIDKYLDEYDHEIWKENLGHVDSKTAKQVEGGHASIDKLVLRAFVESIKYDTPEPIDVYDCAAWMCITALSEASIAQGGAPVSIPDFTNGKWMTNKFERHSKWSI